MPAEGGSSHGQHTPECVFPNMSPRAKLTIQAHPPVCRPTGETRWAFFSFLALPPPLG